MVAPSPENVTLHTLHEDLKAGFGDLKAILGAGFASLPTRESSEEMVRLLRESTRSSRAGATVALPRRRVDAGGQASGPHVAAANAPL